MATKKRKILVHVCCAACASYAFSEIDKDNFQIIAYFYNPETHGLSEYKKRLHDVELLCQDRGIELIVPEYNVQDFFSMILPFQDKNSIKYITDKSRYRRKRCQLCLSLLVGNTAETAKKMRIKYFSTTLLGSPYKDHNEIWDQGLQNENKFKINFYYKDFRKGYWNGRNYARSHNLSIPSYCGCNDSVEEGRLE